MREILFRGKQIDNGDWIDGYIVNHKDESFILKSYKSDYDCEYRVHQSKVISETIGQFTGLLDKKGVKIFTDDIIMATMSDGTKIYKLVVWDNDYMGFGLQNLPISRFESIQHFCNNDNYFDHFDIAGNRFNNPELMGVGK